MTPLTCPKCGREAIDETLSCPGCGQELKNGTVGEKGGLTSKPPVPAEAAAWVIEKVPPEVIAWARQTFNEEEFLAGVREIRETGGLRFEDFVEELKQAAGVHE